MDTLKRFIHYYKPYRTVFFLDLICAATISVIDLVYPQILRTATNSLFTKDSVMVQRSHFKNACANRVGTLCHVYNSEPL